MTSLVPIWPQTSTVLQVMPEVLPKFHKQMILMTGLIPIQPRTSTVLQVTLEALPKFHRQMILMTSLIPILPCTSRFIRLCRRRCPNPTGKCNQWQVLCPNSTTHIHSSSGHAGGAAQIPQANDINNKSHPNLSTHITICQVTLEALPESHRWMQLMTCLIPIGPQTSTICQVTPEALPKFHRQTQFMTRLVTIWPQSSTVLQVTPEALPKFHRQAILMTSLVPFWPRISTIVQQVMPDPQANTSNDKSHPNSTTNIHNSPDYARGTQTPQTNTINDMVGASKCGANHKM